MRRFPSSWDKTLTALGFRRKRRNESKGANRGRRSRCESLERREMLSGTPNQPAYTFVVSDEPGAYDPTDQFVLSTEYQGVEAAPRAVLKLRDDLTDETLDIALQEIAIELRQGDQVLETQSILVDIAEAAFIESFNEDRREIADGVLDDFTVSASPDQSFDIEVLLDVDSYEQGRRSGAIGTVEAVEHYNAFVAAIVSTNDLIQNPAAFEDYGQALHDAEALANAGLLMTGRLRQDAASGDVSLSAAANLAIQSFGEYGGAYYTIFSGLGQNHEIAREENFGGAETFVLAIVEEPVFEASESLRVELGGKPAMVQALISVGSYSSPEIASLTAQIGAATQDTYVGTGGTTAQGAATELFAYRVDDGNGGKLHNHTLFTVDLDGVSSLVPDLAQVTLQAADSLGSPSQQIQAHYDFWSDDLWDESTLVWSDYDTQLAPKFRSLSGSADVTVSAPGSVTFDVTEAVQRALLGGDGNADGQVAAIPQLQRGDIEAIYLAASDKDAYLESFGGLLNLIDTASEGGLDFLYRNDLNWDGAVTGADVYQAAKRLDVLGDFNLDGATDGADYSIWQANYGARVNRYQDGDANADNVVDAADYTAWRDGENKSSGVAHTPQLTFRVVSTTDGIVKYDAPTVDPSFTGIEVTATSAVQAQSFVSEPNDTGWIVDYEVLHDSGLPLSIEVYQAPVVDGALGSETLIYTSPSLSGAIGSDSHSIPASDIDLHGPSGEYKLFAKVIAGGNVVSTREFEGGVFYDQNDALHVYGSNKDNSVSILPHAVFWSRDLNDVQASPHTTFDEILYYSSYSTPTAVYVQTGDGNDQLSAHAGLGITVNLEGGAGDDTYSLGGSTVGDLTVQIGDTMGFDTLDGFSWTYSPTAGGVLDLRSADPQTFVDPATLHQITIDFREGGEVQFVGSSLQGALPISGPGYDSTAIFVDSLGNSFDGLLGNDQLELREAIELANVIPGPHTIVFDTELFDTGSESLLVGDDPRKPGFYNELEITDDLVIFGPSRDLLTLDAEQQSRAFFVHQGVDLTLTDFTVQNGFTTGYDEGGALYIKDATLTVERMGWLDNHSEGSTSWAGGHGGAIAAYNSDVHIVDSLFVRNEAKWGGAVYHRPDSGESLLVEGSTLANNEASQYGSALTIYSHSANAGSAEFYNTTISENHAGLGGAVYLSGNQDTSQLEVRFVNSTIARNTALSAVNGGGGIFDSVKTNDALRLDNTIIAENKQGTNDPSSGSSKDLYAYRSVAGSHNLLGVGSGTAATGSLQNTVDIGSGSAGLMPLSDYGGLTPTHALLPDSPAINKGDNLLAMNAAGAALLADQQGPRFDRILGDAVDIGAFESAIVDETVASNRVIKAYGSIGDDQIIVGPTGISLDWHNNTLYPVSIDQQTEVEISGGVGDDLLLVTGLLAESTTLRGGDGDDTLIGGGGLSNKLYGGADNDTVYATTSASLDTVYEGLGDDTYIFSSTSAGATLLRSGDGETAGGIDTIDFSNLSNGVTFDLTLVQAQINNSLILDQTTNSALIENLIGTDYDDILTGNDLDNALIGNDGRDTLRGGPGDDYIIGGEGDDDELSGGPGQDLIQGNEGDDHLFGNDDVDSLYGGPGDDELSPGDGTDVADGGSGTDTYLVDPTESYADDRLVDPDGEPGIQEPGGPVNHPPVFSEMPTQQVAYAGGTFNLALNADPGDLNQSVTYTYSSSVPLENVTFDTASGSFSWLPPSSLADQSIQLLFTAEDSSAVPLTDTHALTLEIAPSPTEPLSDLFLFPQFTDASGTDTHFSTLNFRPRGISNNDYSTISIDARPVNLEGEIAWENVYSGDASLASIRNIYVEFDDYPFLDHPSPAGQRFDIRVQYTDSQSGELSPYQYATTLLPTGTIDFIIDSQFSQQSSTTSGPFTWRWDDSIMPVDYTHLTPDTVVVHGWEPGSYEWVYLDEVDASAGVYTDSRPRSEQSSRYRFSTRANGSEIAYQRGSHNGSGLNATSDVEPLILIETRSAGYQVPGDAQFGYVEAVRVNNDIEQGLYIGTNNGYNLGYSDFGNPSTNDTRFSTPSQPTPEFTYIYTNGLAEAISPDIPRFWNPTIEYWGGFDLRGSSSTDQTLPQQSPEYFGQPGSILSHVYTSLDDLFYAQGHTPSISKGDSGIRVEMLWDDRPEGSPLLQQGIVPVPPADAIPLTINIPITVVDIDLEIAGLTNLEEHTTGAVIQRNSDFSKGLSNAEGPIQDNNRDPVTDNWVFDENPTNAGTPNAVLTPATLSWNAQVHDDLAIILNYPDDVLVWNVTGGANEVIESGVPFMSLTDGMDLRIEGLERSEAWATTAIEAMFVDPDNYAAIVDTDAAKYTVVDFTALVDGDRDGSFSADTPEDRSLAFWYNTDVDRVRGDNATTWDTSTDAFYYTGIYDAAVPSDVPEIGYTSRTNGRSTGRDYQDLYIRSTADLEDFSLLSLDIDPLLFTNNETSIDYSVWILPDSQSQLGATVESGVNFHQGPEPTSSLAHLDRSYEQGQIRSAEVAAVHGDFDSTALPGTLLSAGRNGLLFEAVPDLSAPTGNDILHEYESDGITLRFLANVKINGSTIGSVSTDVQLSLHDISSFYDYFDVTHDSGLGIDLRLEPDTGSFSAYNTVREASITGAGSSAIGATDDYLVFVHGWNMSDEWKASFANTAYKRLYWEGYAGNFGAFSWPTFIDDDYPLLPTAVDTLAARNYNPSEFVAYRSAEALKNLFESLQQDGVMPDVFAHSMGNVVVSEALRLWQIENGNQQAVGTYTAMQAAVHADAYGVTDGGSLEEENWYAQFPPNAGQSDEWMFANSAPAADNWINIYNEADTALESWQINNFIKGVTSRFVGGPQWPHTYSESIFLSAFSPEYKRFSPQQRGVGLDFWDQNTGKLINGYELLAFFGVSDLSPGAMGGQAVGGRFTDVRLDTLGYSTTMPGGTDGANHSFQFFYDYATTAPFWRQIIDGSESSTTR